MNELCPTCGQRWPEKRSGRICGKCHRPITRHHKFYFDGSTVQHRDCESPEKYSDQDADTPGTMELIHEQQ